jgi:hypothetical protein
MSDSLERPPHRFGIGRCKSPLPAANHQRGAGAPHSKGISDDRKSTKYKAQSTKYQAYAC